MSRRANQDGIGAETPLFGRVWRDYISRRKGLFVLAGLSGLLIAGSSGLMAQALKPAVDGSLTYKTATNLWYIPALIVGLALVRGAIQVFQSILVNRVGNRVVGDMQISLFDRLMRADLARLRSAHTGTYLSSVLYDAQLIRQAFTDGIISYSREALMVVAMIGVMFWNDATLTVVGLIGAPLIVLVMRRFAKRTRKATQGAMAETSNLSTAVMESLDGIKIVKIENREDEEVARVAEVVARRQTFLIKGSNAKAVSTPAMETVSMVIIAAVLVVAGWRARATGMTPGGFTAFLVAMMAAAQSLRVIANLQAVFSEGFAAARRLFAALDIQPTIHDPAAPEALPPGPCSLRVEQVTFGYEEGAPALAELSIEARPGETVALVGPSGGGKSTVLNLIPRFYDPGSGRVTLNGQDIRTAALADLRGRIALVTQEPFLFDDTIRGNIAYARPEATAAEIEAAAEAAAAHEFIQALPQGYDTPVGEAGARLSGGQRQRIAIARAFLKDAPILLLDEATSALDTESEAKVQTALERLMQGRTTLLIAHRLSTVRGADRIYVIDAGRVVEQGSHAALMKKGGLYARLARTQDLETAPLTVEDVS